MKNRFAFLIIFAALALPHFVQGQVRLSISDQKRFDSYYSRWQSYRATNNQSEVRSMEGRMQDVYQHYGIPGNTPYRNVASGGGGGSWQTGGWNGSPAQGGQPDWRTERDRDYRHQEWERSHNRDRDHDWERDHHDRWTHDRDRDWHHDHDREVRHDQGLHRGWYKDHDHDRDHDKDRHHDRDHHADHDRGEHKDRDHDHDRNHKDHDPRP